METIYDAVPSPEDVECESGRPRLHLLVGSTGIKMIGEREWKTGKHGAPYRRQWRKVHIGIDAETLNIRAIEFTNNAIGNAQMHCFKLLGQRLVARTFDRQMTELQVRAAILNRFSQIGTPNTIRVANNIKKSATCPHSALCNNTPSHRPAHHGRVYFL